MSPEEFSISTASLAECELVTLDGELDGTTAGEVMETVEPLLAADRRIVIDLTKLRFLDSRGIHALMQAAGDGSRVSLVCPHGNVSRVLSIVQMERVVHVHESLDDALDDLRRQDSR